MKQMNDNFFYVATEMSFDGKLVKGAPYSGQGVTEVVQVLSDGNRIVNRSTTMIYRDSEGRTRKESTLRTPFGSSGEEPPVTIFISDPVGGTTYVLDTKTRVARKMPSYRFEWKTPGTAVGERKIRLHYQGQSGVKPPHSKGLSERLGLEDYFNSLTRNRSVRCRAKA